MEAELEAGLEVDAEAVGCAEEVWAVEWRVAAPLGAVRKVVPEEAGLGQAKVEHRRSRLSHRSAQDMCLQSRGLQQGPNVRRLSVCA